MKIVVLMGGTSSEREVSLSSGANIAAALKENGHDVLLIDTVLPIEQLETEIEVNREFIEKGDRNLLTLLMDPVLQSADFFFSALHGGNGENGIVQGILESFGYKFNGTSAEGCAIAMDKVISKMIFEKNGIPTPRWRYFEQSNGLSDNETSAEILKEFRVPFVVKPGHEGSTVGLTIVDRPDNLKAAIEEALKYNSVFLVEEYIPGRELTVAILGNQALPVVEICPRHGIYDYECKYTSGMSEYHVPAEIGIEVAASIQADSVKAFNLLRCSGYGRMDLRLKDNKQPYFLEMNTLPGMTATSLVPKAAKAVGMNFKQLLEEIINLGMASDE